MEQLASYVREVYKEASEGEGTCGGPLQRWGGKEWHLHHHIQHLQYTGGEQARMGVDRDGGVRGLRAGMGAGAGAPGEEA